MLADLCSQWPWKWICNLIWHWSSSLTYCIFHSTNQTMEKCQCHSKPALRPNVVNPKFYLLNQKKKKGKKIAITNIVSVSWFITPECADYIDTATQRSWNLIGPMKVDMTGRCAAKWMTIKWGLSTAVNKYDTIYHSNCKSDPHPTHKRLAEKCYFFKATNPTIVVFLLQVTLRHWVNPKY